MHLLSGRWAQLFPYRMPSIPRHLHQRLNRIRIGLGAAREVLPKTAADLAGVGTTVLVSRWYKQTYLQRDSPPATPKAHFRAHWREGTVRPNPTFDPLFVAKSLDLPETDDPLAGARPQPKRIDYTCRWFSRREYLLRYPDVAQSWSNAPEMHFLYWGIKEGRSPALNFRVRERGKPAGRYSRAEHLVEEFTWYGKTYEVVWAGITTSILRQIRDQARHEISLNAPGPRALPNLSIFAATDVKARNGIDLAGLLGAAGDACDVAIFIPWVQLGGGDRYIAELSREMRAQTNARILVIVSEWTGRQTQPFQAYDFLAPLFNSRMLHWREFVSKGETEAWSAALFMNKLRPRHIIVANSDLGHTMLARHGRALASFARCTSVFFSESPDALGAPYSARFFLDECDFSEILTDNGRMADLLGTRAANLFDSRIVVLPPKIDLGTPEEQREAVRRRCLNGRAPTKRCVWVGRVEPFKGTDILLELAAAKSDLTFDIFGPASEEMRRLLKRRHNIRYRGEFPSLRGIAFQDYDFFLFTSMFEGMPNSVLEAVAMAIPVIASDVGGLRETFSDGELSLVQLAEDCAGTAKRFADAIDEIRHLPPERLAQRLRAACASLGRRHGPAAFAGNVRKYLA